MMLNSVVLVGIVLIATVNLSASFKYRLVSRTFKRIPCVQQTSHIKTKNAYVLQMSTVDGSIDGTVPDAEKAPEVPTVKTMTLLDRVKSVLSGNGLNNRTITKETISKLGLNMLLSYGFVSNVSYITCVILAWVSFGRSTGLSPLAAGQWKKFLVVYAGFWAFNNIIRPLRFSLSLVLAPAFERIIDAIQKKTGFKRPVATGITVFLINFCGTISLLVGGLTLATAAAKVPLLP